MELTPRARLIILESKAPLRDGDAAKRIYGPKIEAIAPTAQYAGWISHKFEGQKPAHNFLIDQPSIGQVEALNDLIASGAIEGKVILERYDQ